MKSIRKLLAFVALAFCASLAAAQNMRELYREKGFSIAAWYNENTQPGDAVFVRLSLESVKAKDKAQLAQSSGTLRLYELEGEKVSRKADFYHVSENELLCGLPLSSYAKPGLYTLKAEVRALEKEPVTLVLPLTVTHKEFVSETIPLDSANTSIKTNYGKERMAQIERLNKILATTDSSAVYATAAFVPPTPEKRRTSFFADRRVFTYTGGGSSTSLHYGIDYGVPTGSEVRACAPGKVVMAEDRISTGWSVCVEHLPGLYSLYYHMSRLDVAVGDMVSAGDLLGLSGATGLATGPHLHWEIRLNMEAVSPDFFVSDFTSEQASKAR